MSGKDLEKNLHSPAERTSGNEAPQAPVNGSFAPVQPRKKAKILRWKGVLDDSNLMLRRMVFVVLVVAGVAFTFTQLGFVDIQLPDGSVGYMVALLQVVAIGALLLGTFAGAALGLITGCVLYLHAQFLPLDHYELAFVTPFTSIVMFGICGTLLGILFAFVLRNNPSRIKRIVYITIVCILVSWLYNISFTLNVFVSLVVFIAERAGADAPEEFVQQMAVSTMTQLGRLDVQLWSTGLLMALLCSVGDIAAEKVKTRKNALGLRSIFGIWLAVVVALAFLTMSAFSFAVASNDGLNDAERVMQDEVGYLNNQFQVANQRANQLEKIFKKGELDYDKLDEALLEESVEYFEDSKILEGYASADEGAIIIAVDGRVYTSDDERFQAGSLLDEALSPSTLEAIELSKDTGKMQRCNFYLPDQSGSAPEDNEQVEPDSETEVDTQTTPSGPVYIAYIYAEDASNSITTLTGEELPVDQTIIMIRSSDQVFAQRATVMGGMTISTLVLLVGVFFIVFALLNRVVARQIDKTNATLARITAGDLDARVEADDTREFESLANDINATVDTLQGWIAEAEARMDAELATAWAIQEAALPRIFPPFPEVLKFDIYATMKPARQVGGDFYDFFLIGDDYSESKGKLGFMVADVSGKGVPAALFMMRAKELLRDYVSAGLELGEAVTEANRLIMDGNDEGMFVTAWVGVLDYGTGHVDYVNAGHNPPLLWQRKDGWQWMRQKSGPVLGLFELPYRAHSVDCTAGDTFLLYTDGVTEAFNTNEELYGEDRLLALAEQGYRMHPRELVEALRTDIIGYADGAEQSDDVTILALEVGVPPEVTATLTVPAEVSELYRVNKFLHAELDRRLCPQRTQNQLDIAVEELFVNVCRYAYPEGEKGTVRIQRTYVVDPQSIVVDIIDDGIPYNPLEKPDAVTPSNIEDVPIGGLGILMAKKCTDEMYYERVDDSNVVTIVKKW